MLTSSASVKSGNNAGGSTAIKGPWLFGRFTIVDAMFAPVALRFHSYQLTTNAEGQAYVNTVLNYPAVKAWIEAGKLETEVIAAFE